MKQSIYSFKQLLSGGLLCCVSVSAMPLLLPFVQIYPLQEFFPVFDWIPFSNMV